MTPDPLQDLWQHQETAPMPIDLDAIRARARAFERRLKARNRREIAAAAFVVLAFAGLAVHGAFLFRTACFLVIAGTLVVAKRVHEARPADPPPEAGTAAHLAAHRRELARQKRLLETVGRWYVAPFVPGLVLFHVATVLERGPFQHGPTPWPVAAASLAFCAVVGAAIVLVNRRAAKALGREMAALPG